MLLSVVVFTGYCVAKYMMMMMMMMITKITWLTV